VAYKIVIRKNGKSHGEMGPYSSQQAAQSDARTIKIRLSEDADVVVQRVEIGGVRYRPEGAKPSASSFSPPPGKLPYVAPPPRIAAGGVVINDDGLILVREPLNHFDGYVWSLPKGGVDKGETLEQGALREVEEETGVRAEIVERIPGEWKSTSALNRYFLMRVIENTGVLDNETAQIAFVTYDEAKELLSLSTNKRGRERDLAVLDAGYGLWLKLKHAAKSNPRHRFA
jgi:8-oxo-dGTP diphosphatase